MSWDGIVHTIHLIHENTHVFLLTKVSWLDIIKEAYKNITVTIHGQNYIRTQQKNMNLTHKYIKTTCHSRPILHVRWMYLVSNMQHRHIIINVTQSFVIGSYFLFHYVESWKISKHVFPQKKTCIKYLNFRHRL